MNQTRPTSVLRRLGLVNLIEEYHRLVGSRRTAVYGTVRTVVWEDGGGNHASYPIVSAMC